MSQWTEQMFEEDLENLKQKKYDLLSFPSCEIPSDDFLLNRYNLVKVLSLFQQNLFEQQKQVTNDLTPLFLKFLESFDSSFLSEFKPSPPFDLMLISFIVCDSSEPNYLLLIRLFQYYLKVLNMINEGNGPFFLNDRTKRTEIENDKETSLRITQQRLDYLAEIITSLLHSRGQDQLLQSFLVDICPPSFTKDMTTLSQLGRMALACGDGRLAQKYFEKVTDPLLISANFGYMQFFNQSFQAGLTSFRAAKEQGPKNADICLKYLGQLVIDPNDTLSRKQSPEERSRWPQQPKQ